MPDDQNSASTHASKDIGEYGVRVRMYRQGVGDCFLLRFAGSDTSQDGEANKPYSILIDCGVHSSTKGGSDFIRDVVADIEAETGGHLDIVVGTHEHWDHISGFHQARETFKNMTANQAWLGWTEDEDDELTQKIALKNKRYRTLNILSKATTAMDMAGAPVSKKMEGLLGFYGPGAGKNLKKAGDALKRLAGNNIRYLKPEDDPIELPGIDARVFALGPPRDEALINKSNPSKQNSEVYEFGSFMPAAEQLNGALSSEGRPFAYRYGVPLEASKGVDFFARRYWSVVDADDGPDHEKFELTQFWRRIQTSWLSMSESLALHLDHDTNNTSLVLAIELSPKDQNGPVMIFAADAQVGNWLGWRHHTWSVGGRAVTGEDLMRRTIVYKVGHHASHNATLEEHGLELMDDLEVALIPTSQDMAHKVGWGNIPWPPLLDRLKEMANTKVIRSDRRTASDLGSFGIDKHDLYYEISF